MTWSEARAKGTAPEGRVGHAAAVATVAAEGCRIFIFGGRNAKGVTLNDMHILYTSKVPFRMLRNSQLNFLTDRRYARLAMGEGHP